MILMLREIDDLLHKPCNDESKHRQYNPAPPNGKDRADFTADFILVSMN
jgi:hypothetical protein